MTINCRNFEKKNIGELAMLLSIDGLNSIRI